MILQTATAGACWARLLAALLLTSRAAAEAGAPPGSGQPRPRSAQFVPSFGPPVQQPVFEFYHEPQHYTGQAFGDSFAPSPPDPLLNALQATAAPHTELQSNVPERLQLSAQPPDLSQLLPASLYAASPLYKALDKAAPLEVTEAPITTQTPQPPQSSLHNPHSFHSVVNYGVISVHHGDHFEPHNNNGVAEPDRHHTSLAEQRAATRLGQSTSDAVALSLQPPPAPAAPRSAQRPPDAETVSPEPAGAREAEPK
ncbi:uncharacterized protein LOC126284623 isoform X2 [Schistocerca gregaria]|uniref:uncharacterized protein LOC126284623 isoform X2 n=1 Tax=Schistocerca gregaria TaxID=7010 RepID=UPI00211DFD06|nr:uncharacterized protein LOC126284623 isoform X2 [Schistocerca gregaria]